MNSNKISTSTEQLIWNINICFFCKTHLDKNSKVLKCIHGICENCLRSKWTDLGIQCKCKIITTNGLVDYPVPQFKTCFERICLNDAIKYCSSCQLEFCQSCSMYHLNEDYDHDHVEGDIKDLSGDLIICKNCPEKYAEVYCKYCSKFHCALCHLSGHRNHVFIILEDLEKETRFIISDQKGIIDDNEKSILQCLLLNEDYNKILKNKFSEAKHQLNEHFKMVKPELHSHIIEQKKTYKNCYTNICDVITKSIDMLKKLQMKHKLYSNLAKYLLENDKPLVLLLLSTTIIRQLNIVKSYIFINARSIISNTMNELTISLNGTFVQLISNPDFKKIIALPSAIVNFSCIAAEETLDVKYLITNDIQYLILDTRLEYESEDASSETIVSMCDSCHQPLQGTNFQMCCECQKLSHNKCNMLQSSDETNIYEGMQTNWTCTTCQNADKKPILVQRHLE